MNQHTRLRWEDDYAPYRLWFESTAYPNSSGIMLTVRDISARKRSGIILTGQKKALELITKAPALPLF